MDEIVDSPISWIRQHIAAYVATDGAEGHLFNGVPMLLLTTRGRRSGLLRRTAVIYGRRGGDYLVVASDSGAPTHPSWYLNLTADPRVRVQVRADRFDALASVVPADEREAAWKEVTGVFPTFDEYQARTDRVIPVVSLRRTG